jgi:hypothetical protein
MGEHREWLRGHVPRETERTQLTPQAEERALDIAESVFKGSVGVGIAAKIGVDAVVSEVFKKT